MLAEFAIFSVKHMYTFAEYVHCIPVKYKSLKNGPNSIVPTPSMSFYIPFAIFSVVILTMLSIVVFEAAFFGELNTRELFLSIATNNIYIMLILSEWHFLLPSPRRRVISLINCVWGKLYSSSYSPNPTFAFVLLAFSYTAILSYPSTLLTWYCMPGIFRGVHAFIEWITVLIGFTDAETAANFQIIFRLLTFLVISVASGHGANNLLILLIWALTYHTSTVHSLQVLLKFQKKA